MTDSDPVTGLGRDCPNYQHARKLYQHGMLEEARDAALHSISDDLDNAESWGLLSRIYEDMEEPEHRKLVYDTLAEELASAPARTQLLPMSEIGLVQLTRKRTRPSLERTLSRECPYCHGSGRIKALPTVCLEIRRELLAVAAGDLGQQISLVVHPAVSHYLQGPFRELMRELEETHGVQIILRENPLFHEEQFEISE